MHRNTESLCCVTGTNTVLYRSIIIQKQSQKMRQDLWLSETGEGELNEGSLHVQNSYYKINKF